MDWIDPILLLLIALVTWVVSTEGMWGAALRLIDTVLAGLIAMNFFEPVANLMASVFGKTYEHWYDLLSLITLFIIAVCLFRLVTDNLSNKMVRFLPLLDQIGRWVFAAWTGWVTVAFLMTVLHTAPLPGEFLGFGPYKQRFLGLGIPSPDRAWLAFTQRASTTLFDRSRDGSHAFDLWPGALAGGPPGPGDAARSFIARYYTRRADLNNPYLEPKTPQ